MKRFHVHLGVDDLQASIAFYSQLFGSAPSRTESDYAKWMLDDPRLNFAISTRSGKVGLDHLGFQAETESELADMKSRAQSADMALIDEGQTSCCYAESDKYWLTDPQGIAWEQFQTLGNIPVFAQAKPAGESASACCAPASAAAQCAPVQASPVQAVLPPLASVSIGSIGRAGAPPKKGGCC